MAAGFKPTLVDSCTPPSRTLIGEHPLTCKIRALIERVAPAEVTVLISGESGTGKEVVARAIHALSPRAGRPFVPVNCAAIPHEMLESEMFGHERGAFTGAVAARQGLFSMAQGGAIFLDEVSEMSPPLQAKLLRVLEDRLVRPLGADRAVPVDVRVIAASNRDLAGAVRGGSFRADLFYRLQVVPIMLAPLRERRSDIPLLVDHFLARMRQRHPGRGCAVSREAMAYLWAYDWPGNVRELENLVERMVILCEDELIDTVLLPQAVVAGGRGAEPLLPPTPAQGQINLSALVRQFEGRLINDALRRSGGNKHAAARLLGLKPTTFAAKLRRCAVVAAPEGEDRGVR